MRVPPIHRDLPQGAGSALDVKEVEPQHLTIRRPTRHKWAGVKGREESRVSAIRIRDVERAVLSVSDAFSIRRPICSACPQITQTLDGSSWKPHNPVGGAR